jgi:mRNA interferase HicA
VKYRELIKGLQKSGWYLLRQGGRHEIWTNGEIEEPVPRHREINELLAKKILKRALMHPRKGH